MPVDAAGARPSAGFRRLLRHGRPVRRRSRDRLRSAQAAGRETRRRGPRGSALMHLTEINFDGIVGPSHNYAGLSPGNLASQPNAGEESQPRAAALQGVDKMRANLALGLAQGIFVPAPRPNRAWLAELGTTIDAADPVIAANALSASAMWAANAATVSPAPDTAVGRCHLTVANLKTMAHRSPEWPATLMQLQPACAADALAVQRPSPPAFAGEGGATTVRWPSTQGRAAATIWR